MSIGSGLRNGFSSLAFCPQKLNLSISTTQHGLKLNLHEKYYWEHFEVFRNSVQTL